MINFFQSFYILAILLLFITARVSGAQCEEEMGICDENCNVRCETSKNGKGICEKLSPNEVGTCKCLYECGNNGNKNGNDNENSLSKNKQCNLGIGPCSWQCNDVCCDQNCAAEYPGPQEGHGACMDIVGIPSLHQCICYFNC
ncbi:low-molecular-weight cysteine-rich 80 [Hibiscus trionum]|uniref:Defensin-like protein n=1 Tax=Hibiscus trionum TaxID=183268 RepID=A0A9W7MAW7_HIBTR|nr:low-molecular-weight cysteine-rich 80 [Hibiscus trionum]